MKAMILSLFLALARAGAATDPCVILDSRQHSTFGLHDDLFLLLTSLDHCPMNVIVLEEAFNRHNWQLSSTMVANRGRLNPIKGSFSFFEVAQKEGKEIFFGHFTRRVNNTVELRISDHGSRENSLLKQSLLIKKRASITFMSSSAKMHPQHNGITEATHRMPF